MTALQPSRRDPLRLNRSRPLHFEPLENRRLLAVSAGANLVPKAFPDAAMTHGNTSAIVDVIRNDYDTDGSLDPTTVQVVGRPKAGTVEVRSDGTVSYRPPANRFGVDSFIYTVQDNLGASSNPANVRIEVRSVWQNSSDALDVNGDGGFSPIDILRVLNELNRRGAGMLEHPPQYPVTPPPYVDVTGDGYLTAADALFAINCLNSQSRADSLGYCPLPELPVFTQTHSQDGVQLPSETSAEPPSDPESPARPDEPIDPVHSEDDQKDSGGAAGGEGSTLPPKPFEEEEPFETTPKSEPMGRLLAGNPAELDVHDQSWLDDFLPLLAEADRHSGAADDKLELALAELADPLLDHGIDTLGLL